MSDPLQKRRIHVERLRDKQLRLTARRHEVITDRTPAEGGSDRGCTSGELLLMAIGSCAAGSLRNHLQKRGVAEPQFTIEVGFEPVAGQRDRIAIAITPLDEAARFSDEIIAQAATSGAVVSRMKLGSDVQVQLVRGVSQHGRSRLPESEEK